MQRIDLKELKKQLNQKTNVFNIKLENAKNVIIYFWNNLIDEKIEWIEEYDKIAEWLTDNKGKGLFLYGANGRGKSMMARIVLPAIIEYFFRKKFVVYTYVNVNEKLNEILTKRFIVIDDIGKEDILNNFGTKRVSFAEIMDNCEVKGNMAIITSNLDGTQIIEKYDNAVLDRIKSCCFRIPFKGVSFRE